MTVAVLGAGSWGTTLANQLARQGTAVRLWAHEAEVAEAITHQHANPLYLAEAPLHPSLTASTDLAMVLTGATLVLTVAPSQVTRRVLAAAAPHIAQGTPLVSASKGIEVGTLALMHEVARDTVPHAPFVAFSGPSFAREVYDGQPTAVVAASTDAGAATAVQAAFAGPRLRVYTARDVVGVELAGALKNVIAIAAGVLEGLGMGYNPRAALITRGLAEIARLGVAMGADPLTFAGLAGMGDLILTCGGALSRNRALGEALARGESFAQHRATHRSVAEGAETSEAAVALAARHGVELPICAEVARLLFHGGQVRESVAALMERAPRAEQWR